MKLKEQKNTHSFQLMIFVILVAIATYSITMLIVSFIMFYNNYEALVLNEVLSIVIFSLTVGFVVSSTLTDLTSRKGTAFSHLFKKNVMRKLGEDIFGDKFSDEAFEEFYVKYINGMGLLFTTMMTDLIMNEHIKRGTPGFEPACGNNFRGDVSFCPPIDEDNYLFDDDDKDIL